ncbi:MAG: hypothetical protein WAW61_22425 [Methylococcaceae bacterium]
MTTILRATLSAIGIALVACLSIGLLFHYVGNWIIDAIIEGAD